MQLTIRLNMGTPMKELEKGLKKLKDLHPHGKNIIIISQGTEGERVIGRGSTFMESSWWVEVGEWERRV